MSRSQINLCQALCMKGICKKLQASAKKSTQLLVSAWIAGINILLCVRNCMYYSAMTQQKKKATYSTTSLCRQHSGGQWQGYILGLGQVSRIENFILYSLQLGSRYLNVLSSARVQKKAYSYYLLLKESICPSNSIAR